MWTKIVDIWNPFGPSPCPRYWLHLPCPAIPLTPLPPPLRGHHKLKPQKATKKLRNSLSLSPPFILHPSSFILLWATVVVATPDHFSRCRSIVGRPAAAEEERKKPPSSFPVSRDCSTLRPWVHCKLEGDGPICLWQTKGP